MSKNNFSTPSAEKQFILISCNPGNEELLKKEIAYRFPHLHLSFSRSGLISFKNSSSPYSAQQLIELQVAFSRRVSLFCQKCNLAQLEEVTASLCQRYQPKAIHQVSFVDFQYQTCPTSFDGNLVLCRYQLDHDLYWFSVYSHHRQLSAMPDSHYPLVLPEAAPSRAWLKMAETEARFGLLKKSQKVLELGSSPGGISYFLLEKGLEVLAIDPGDMDEICLNHPAFLHLKKPVQECKAAEIAPFAAQWIAVDMNLPAAFSVRETSRLAQIAKKTLLGVIVTIKIPQSELVELLTQFSTSFKKIGIVKSQFAQLEAHKREILFIGLTELAIKQGCDL